MVNHLSIQDKQNKKKLQGNQNKQQDQKKFATKLNILKAKQWKLK